MSATFPFATPRSLDDEPEAQRLLAEQGPVVLAKMPLPAMVICELLGAPYSDAPDIRRWTGWLMTSVLTPEELRQPGNDMRGYPADLVEEKRVRPDDKLITALTAAHDEGGHLTSAELLANLQILLAVDEAAPTYRMETSVRALHGLPVIW